MTYPTGGTSSPSRFNEGAVELAAMSWLDLSGWRVLPGDYLAPDGPMSARSDYRQTVLEGQLRDALATRDGLRLARGVEQADRDLASVVWIDDAHALGHGQAVARAKPATREDEASDAGFADLDG